MPCTECELPISLKDLPAHKYYFCPKRENVKQNVAKDLQNVQTPVFKASKSIVTGETSTGKLRGKLFSSNENESLIAKTNNWGGHSKKLETHVAKFKMGVQNSYLVHFISNAFCVDVDNGDKIFIKFNRQSGFK